jgi:signal peptidase I
VIKINILPIYKRLKRFSIDKTSMEPIIISGDRILAIKSTKLRRGDIVFFKHAVSEPFRVKRIIGLPGEKLEIVAGRILINDLKLANYVQCCKSYPDYGPVQVPEDHYFLLGDHREISKDSRHLGAISIDEIRYKALAIYRPISRFKILL